MTNDTPPANDDALRVRELSVNQAVIVLRRDEAGTLHATVHGDKGEEMYELGKAMIKLLGVLGDEATAALARSGGAQ